MENEFTLPNEIKSSLLERPQEKEDDSYLNEKYSSLKPQEQSTLITYETTLVSDEIDNRPWNETNFKLILKDFATISSSSLLISCSYFSNLILMLLNLHFIGDHGDPILISAVGLGTVWINALGINTIYGLNYGFEIMASKSYGAEDFYKIGVYYKKAILVIVIVLSIFSGISFGTECIFNLLGQNAAVSFKVYQYTIFMLPALWFASFFDLRTLYLNAQQIFSPPIVIQIFTTAGHFGWCILFMKYDLDVVGIALAMNITLFLNFVLLEIYMLIMNPCKRSNAPWNRDILKGFREYIDITIPIAMTTVLEEFSYEINSIMAGLINETVLAAHVSIANTSTFIYCLLEGFSTGINTYVGISIGEKKVHKAKRCAILGVIGGLSIMSIVYTLLFFLKNYWAEFFTNEKNINNLMVQTMWIFILAGMSDTVQMCLGAILKVTGKGKLTLILYFLCLYVVANPLSFVLGNVLHWDLIGIWLGILIGLSLLALSFIIGVFKINWRKEIENADENVEVKEIMEEKRKEEKTNI